MTFDPVNAVADLQAQIDAIKQDLGIVPGGVYADTRVRLDILEARINNPNSAAPNVEDPFIIGNNGVTISTGDGYPTENRLPGSLYLRRDGYDIEGLYTVRTDGYWHQIDTTPWTAAGDLSGDTTSQTVIGLQTRSVSSTAPTDGYVLTWDSGNNDWEPKINLGISRLVVCPITDADFTPNSSQYQAKIMEFTGTTTLSRDINMPNNIGDQWIVFNNTTGGNSLVFKVLGQTGVTVAATKRAIIYCDGTDIVRVTADT